MLENIRELLQAQGDYFAFSAVALFVIGLSSWGIRRFRAAARFSWQLWGLSVIVLLSGWIATQRAGEYARDESSALISAMAPTYASELERGGHRLITEKTATNDPVYLELIAAEIRWEKLNPFAHDIYTFRKRADGTNILVVDSETDYDKNGDFNGTNESRTPIGQVYLQPIKGLELAYKGVANFDSEIYSDAWGTWVSAFVPMRDENGRVEAVLGVDFNAKTWVAAIAKARRGAIWVTAFVLAIVFGGGLIITLLRADLARRVEAEQRVRASEQRLLLTIRQMPLGFIEWDVTARVRAWNPAAERIFGFSESEVIDRSAFPLIVAKGAAKQVDELWANLLRNTGGHHSINENNTKSGQSIICEWFNTPLVGADGKVIAVFSLFQDITARLSLEKQLQHSERLSAVGQLSAGVAHDFNNILTIIIGHAGLLKGRNDLPAEIQTDIGRMEEAALRAASLTRQLLTFSRQQAMFPRPLALDKVVRDIASMLSRLMSATVNFKVVTAAYVPIIEADPAMIEQVVTNLVLNARDALTNGGDITVIVDLAEIHPEDAVESPNARPGPAVRLIVKDTGAGISPENLSRIFEPFYTTKPVGQGTGLGLSVVQGIIQQHGGWIAVDSTLGKGTTFRVHFPPSKHQVAESPKVEAPKPVAPHVIPAAGQTILLAEDEELVRELACYALEQAGYTVLTAGDGPKALEIWAKNRDKIDLLLTDMVMPNGITGRELSERLRAERPDLPIIYVSGYSLDMTVPGFCESDQMLFVPKPYQPQQLIAAVRRCFGQGQG